MPDDAPRGLDRVRHARRAPHDASRTAAASVGWIRRVMLFPGQRHPQERGIPEIDAFLTDRAGTHQVAASTHNRALRAVLFLSHAVVQPPLDGSWVLCGPGSRTVCRPC